MNNFRILRLPYELTSNSGLALIGQYFKLMRLDQHVDPAFPVRDTAISVLNSDILKSYLGLLVQGKTDFDAIEAYRDERFFAEALGIRNVPSSPTLRQRMDTHAAAWFLLLDSLNEFLLRNAKAVFRPLACGRVPLDLDVFPMNNAQTKKEGVSRVYNGVDGYAPLACYLGADGYCLELALRPGSSHSAKETEHNLERVLPMAKRLTPAPLLVRMDSGFDSVKLMREIRQAHTEDRPVDFLVKWNPRRGWRDLACRVAESTDTLWCLHREGKRETVWEEALTLEGVGAVRRIYRLTERTIDKHGQRLLVPDWDLEGWTTTLPASVDKTEVIALYADHATHEQFHAEFKTDMDLERLPSGKFDTNYLVCGLAAIALNMLRLMGQNTLLGPKSPVRHGAQRRRVKTVMKELMFKAGRLIRHAGQWWLGLGRQDKGCEVFAEYYGVLKAQAG
jgi:hypothetical protein